MKTIHLSYVLYKKNTATVLPHLGWFHEKRPSVQCLRYINFVFTTADQLIEIFLCFNPWISDRRLRLEILALACRNGHTECLGQAGTQTTLKYVKKTLILVSC